MIEKISVRTHGREEVIDITETVENIISKSKVASGYCIIYVPHTTAAITINENADPAVKRDVLKILDKLIPQNGDYEHFEGNSPAHIKSILTGISQMILIENGKLKLGTWQGIYLCEYDGPRSRSVLIKIIST
ncbi:MAG: YjbQ family protein [Candidatus Helarchaeota archaeon]|nr:YjbQ family protein [Candidatus Helarchaeota archaeon]